MKGRTLIKIGGGMILVVTLSGIALAQDLIRQTGKDPARVAESEDESVNLVDFPALDISGAENKTTEIGLDLTGQLEGVRARISVETRPPGAAQINMNFDGLDLVPVNKRLVLWALPPSGRSAKVGQIVNSGGRTHGEIRTETYFKDFELILTLEETDVPIPTGPVCSAFRISSE